MDHVEILSFLAVRLEIDWFVDVYTSMIFSSGCRLGCTALHWGISIFWREIKLVLDIGAPDEWYGDHWIISCCPHCILGHSHLVGCFDIEIWLLACDYCFSMDYGAIGTSGLASSAYLDDLRYLHTSHFILRRFTMDTFMPSILPEPDHHILLSYTSHRDTWPHPFLD